MIVGDVNFDVLFNTKTNVGTVNKYLHLVESYDFKVCNDRITRPVSKTLLDHVTCNFSCKVNIDIDTVEVDFSDHCAVFSHVSLPTTFVGKQSVVRSTTDYDLMRSSLAVGWSIVQRPKCVSGSFPRRL